MRLFISWSKEPSKTVAKALSDWLPTVIQAVEPWMSEEDIPAGSRWHSQISNQLATTRFGVVCVTPQNQHEPWIQFEAGALAKAVEAPHGKPTDPTKESYVCPYLIEMPKSALTGPLTAFQGVEANFEDTRKLLKSINEALALAEEKPLRDEVLNTSFERAWPQLEEALRELPAEAPKEPERRPEEMLAEILETVRDTNRKVGDSLLLDYGSSVSREPLALTKLLSSSLLTDSFRNVLLTWDTLAKDDAVSTVSERTFNLEGAEENLSKAIAGMNRYRKQVDISVTSKSPELAEVTLTSKSPFQVDDILKSIKALARRHSVTMTSS